MVEVGGIFIQIDVETEQLIEAGKKANQFLDDLSSSSKSTSKAIDNLSKENKSAASSLNQIASSTKSVDGSMQTLNTTVSAMALAIQQANTSSAAASMTLAQMNGAMNSLIGAANSIAEAMKSAGSGTSAANSEFNRSETIIEGLGNQLAILDEAQENGARSAAILAAQLRAGSAASDAEKAKIGELTGQLYDMKNGTDNGAKSHGNWKNSMQQAGYQVQDFIVQVQGGQSALVAFAQQGSQLAGAFGPQGAVVGALIALGSVIVGTLINSMGNATDTIKTLGDAASQLDNVITVSQSGVAALSDKYALLASTNAKFGQILKTQAIIEYNQALSKIPDAISSLSSSVFGMGDAISAAMSGGMASVSAFGEIISNLPKQTNNVNEAFSMLSSNVGDSRGAVSTFSSTIGSLASNFGITEQQAFELAKRLYEISITKSPEQVQSLALWLQHINGTTPGVTKAFGDLTVNVSNLGVAAAQAEINLERAKAANDALTKSQQLAVTGSERELALAKATGVERAKLQASYKIQDLQLNPDSGQAKEIMANAVATYNAQQAQKTLNAEKKAGVTAANQQARAEESVAQKLEQLRQQSDLNAVSSQNLTLEQTKLRAEMSLGKNATASQREEAAKYAEAIWQQAAALKARNLIPEVAENDDYQSKTAQLELLKGQRDSQGNLIISQQQYQQESEKLAAEHIGNLAKINSQNAVTPQQSLAGQVDPVQQLANENAEKLSLINQYEQAGVLAHGQAAALKQAQDTKYNQDSYDAMWSLWRSQSQINQLMGAGIDTLSSGSASALSGIITGTESAGEAFRNLANGALNAMLEQLIKVGIQAMLVRTVLGSFMGGVSSISSPSVATPSLNTGALGLSSGWQSYVSGARKNGGPVNGSGLYRVGESGKPEIFQASNGSQYMIPGDNGKVISNRNMTTSVSAGGSGSLNIDLGGITVNLPSSSNQPASSVDANGIGKQIKQSVVNAINDQVNRQGTPLWRAIKGR